MDNAIVQPLSDCESKYDHHGLEFGCGVKPNGHMGVHRFFIEWTTDQQVKDKDSDEH